MSHWWDRNLAVLRERAPALADRLSAAAVTAPPLTPTADAQADAVWRDQSGDDPLQLYCFGCEDGAHLRRHLCEPHPEIQTIFVIEQSLATFRAALALADWRPLLQDSRFIWWIGETPAQLERLAFDHFGRIGALAMSVRRRNLVWPPSVQRAGEYYLQAATAIQAGLNARRHSTAGLPEDHFRGLLHLLPNLPHLATTPLFSTLQGSCSGVPGVVIATGPSLNVTLPALQTVADRAVLFACDSAVPILLDAGVTPHFIACLERVVATQRLIEGLPPLPRSWLVSLPVVAPSTLAAYRGPHLTMLPTDVSYRWLLGDAPATWVGPSAATLALVGLMQLGCNPIYLVGQDLAFDRHSPRSHATGAREFLQTIGQETRAEAERAGAENLVEGNDGVPILSWEPYRRIAETFPLLLEGNGVTCYNVIPAAYGMKLRGVVHLEPSHWPAQLQSPAVDVVTRTASRAVTPISSAPDLPPRVYRLQQQLRAVVRQALDLQRQCRETATPAVIEAALQRIAGHAAMQEFLAPYVSRSLLERLEGVYAGHAPLTTLIDWFDEVILWAARVDHLIRRTPLDSCLPAGTIRNFPLPGGEGAGGG